VQFIYVGAAVKCAGWGAVIYMMSAAFLGSGMHVSAIHFIAEHYLLTPETAYIHDPEKT
jgi:hypothetical protein